MKNIFSSMSNICSPRISTRGAGKGVKDEFRLAVKKQVSRWSEPVDETMLLFFKNEKDNLMNTATLMEKSLTY
jgi:hypothetical protein